MRLIDADVLLESIRESAKKAEEWLADCKTYKSNMTARAEQAILTFNECALRIKNAPTVEAVPVVRCRDCEYWDTIPRSTVAPLHHQCKETRLMTTGIWYCPLGKRKDGEHETD